MTGEPIAFTVDVESDWGSGEIRGVTEVLPRLLEMLERRGARATFFVVGELAEAFGRQVGSGSSHEVGSHGLTHRLLTRLDADEVRREVEESKRRLEAEGHLVQGFRAPFLRRPRCLGDALVRAGYRYDASGGSVVPGAGNLLGRLRRARPAGDLRELPTSTLRDGLTPFSLTWLRLFHPLGQRLIPRARSVFYCHLHELLDESPGWPTLPRPLRKLHARHAGRTAWQLLESLLARDRPFVSAGELLDEPPLQPSASRP